MGQLLMEAAQKTHEVTGNRDQASPSRVTLGVSEASILLQWAGRCSPGFPGARELAGVLESWHVWECRGWGQSAGMAQLHCWRAQEACAIS